ncbi:MAG: hypothetical protein U5R48_19920 [Gammaproteobacteria bacterium]|nr:hypothetical protein [Gammaproteobacteria bacterium]
MTLIHTSNSATRCRWRCGSPSGSAPPPAWSRYLFGNSGAEANEAAIKLARLHGHGCGIDVPGDHRHGERLPRPDHGDPERHRQPQGAGRFRTLDGRLRPGPVRRRRGLRRIAAAGSDVVVVLVEPIQGEGGIIVPPEDDLPQPRRSCPCTSRAAADAGRGPNRPRRSRALFHYQHGVLPDAATIAKGIANGVPIGACCARPGGRRPRPGTHVLNLRGNRRPAAGGLANLDVLAQPRASSGPGPETASGGASRGAAATTGSSISRCRPDDRHRAGRACWRTGGPGARGRPAAQRYPATRDDCCHRWS